MDYKEEQELEIESLQAIFDENEIELINNTHYILHLSPETDKQIYVKLDLIVQYTNNYPETPAKIQLLNNLQFSY